MPIAGKNLGFVFKEEQAGWIFCAFVPRRKEPRDPFPVDCHWTGWSVQFWFSAPLNQMENKEVPTELNQISIPVCIVIALVCAVISAAIAFFAGVAHRKKTAEFAIHSAEDEAKRIVSEAIKTAEAKKKEAAAVTADSTVSEKPTETSDNSATAEEQASVKKAKSVNNQKRSKRYVKGNKK